MGDEPAADEDYRAAWKALPRSDRTVLAADAVRGLRGRNQRDAALMLWWAREETRRGPWPAIRFASVSIATIVVIQLVFFDSDVARGVRYAVSSPVLPIMVLIPFTTWFFRRPKLQRSMQLNAAVLAGHRFDGPPDPEEAERILARAKREGWLRGTRPEAEG